MIKKYIMLISAIFVILILTSTGNASFLSLDGDATEESQENSIFKRVFERISQIISYKNSRISSNDEDAQNDDLTDPDVLEEDLLLQETIDVIGEITPDNGNEEVTEQENLDGNPTIDIDGEEGTTLNDELIIDEDGEVGVTDIITLDQDGTEGRTLERIIEIFTENKKDIEKIVERTFALGTTMSEGIAENIVDTVVVVGESVGVVESYISNNVVVTDN